VPGYSGLFVGGVGIDGIITEFFKFFDLVPHDRLCMKLAASGVDSRLVVCVREFIEYEGNYPRKSK